MRRDEALRWLRQTDSCRAVALLEEADRVRRSRVGDAVHLRGLVEISNHCVKRCSYCGLRAPNALLPRYRMSADEVVGAARRASALGLGTIVIQSGEDPGIGDLWVRDVVRRIKEETPLAVTLSLGERSPAVLELWRAAGADRYLLRFETSRPDLYARIHPPREPRTLDRVALLRVLADLGYEVGSGMMVGIPGQRWADLAEDVELCRALDLDMVGLGPFIPHPATPLGRRPPSPGDGDQARADEETTLRVIALVRLACPRANIPATTGLDTIDGSSGYERGLRAGANVIMPGLTPPAQGALWQPYPRRAPRACSDEERVEGIRRRIVAIGRRVGTGRGDAARRRRETDVTTTSDVCGFSCERRVHR